jgi:hypothetical protein
MTLVRVVGHAYMIPDGEQFDWVFRVLGKPGPMIRMWRRRKIFFFYARKILRVGPTNSNDTGGGGLRPPPPPPVCMTSKLHLP